MYSDGGYTRQYRRLWDNPVFRSKQEAAVFSWMKDAAQWRAGVIRTDCGTVRLDIGEVLVSERQLAADFGLHRNVVRALLSRMVAEHMVVIRRSSAKNGTNAGTIIRLVNYCKYQGITGDNDGIQDQHQDQHGTNTGPTRDQHIKIKEGNTGKEEKDSLVHRQNGAARKSVENQEDNEKADGDGQPKPGKRQLDAEFEAFWKRYPRRPRGAKQSARKAYEIARRSAEPDELIRRLERYERQEANTDNRFLVHAERFLSKGYCIDDEEPTARCIWRDPGPDEPPPIAAWSEATYSGGIH